MVRAPDSDIKFAVTDSPLSVMTAPHELDGEKLLLPAQQLASPQPQDMRPAKLTFMLAFFLVAVGLIVAMLDTASDARESLPPPAPQFRSCTDWERGRMTCAPQGGVAVSLREAFMLVGL